jgi:hypothetical protein
MSTLDRFIPVPRLREVDAVDVPTSAARAYAFLRHLDMARAPFVRGLFALRALPDRLRGRQAAAATMTLDDITRGASGFRVLADDGASFAAGAIGQVWKPQIPFREVPRDAFVAFTEPGWAKVAWEVRCEPRGAAHCHVAVEVRVTATDDESWRRFQRYFRLIGPFSRFIRRRTLRRVERAFRVRAARKGRLREVGENVTGALGILFDFATPFLRRARGHWGLSPDEATRALPGDALVAEPDWCWTHAVTIGAPPERVWPWVVQIGQDKGGFYSYTWLENLAGCHIHNADEIRPEWQRLFKGDPLRIHPHAPPLRVEAVEPGRYFVASGRIDPKTGEAPTPEFPERYLEVSWLFFVEPLGDGKSRFVSRYRAHCGRDRWMRAFYGRWTVEPIGFVMDRRMLLGVKERVERLPQPRPLPA